MVLLCLWYRLRALTAAGVVCVCWIYLVDLVASQESTASAIVASAPQEGERRQLAVALVEGRFGCPALTQNAAEYESSRVFACNQANEGEHKAHLHHASSRLTGFVSVPRMA